MEEKEEDYSSLPLIDRVQHKIWKVRLGAYEELTKAFQLSTSDNDPIFKPFKNESLLKKMVTDSNVIAQEAAITCVNAFIEFSSGSSKTAETVIPGIIEKCLGSTRAGTKTKAIDLILMYIQIDSADLILPLILPGIEAKQPKVVATTVTCLREILRNYGTKTVNVKPILKSLLKIFGHSDKNVRSEGVQLAMELYRWLGQAIQPHLTELKPVQIKELNETFEKMPDEKPLQIRFLNSQQPETIADLSGENDDIEQEEHIDAFDLAEPVDVLGKIPPEFDDLMNSKKWQDRKGALDALLNLAKTPRIKPGDYSRITSQLAKRMTDANIVCVTVAANCIEALALGLRSNFASYKGYVVGPMLEKLKERKQSVVDALASALYAVSTTVSLSDIIEDIVGATKHKNPQVKAESMKWLVRNLKETKVAPNKLETKTLADAMIAGLEDAFEPVRTAAAEGLGTLMKVVGERTMNPYLDGLEDIRKTKIKEFFNVAEIKYKPSSATSTIKKTPADMNSKTGSNMKKTIKGGGASKNEITFNKENDPPVKSTETVRKPVGQSTRSTSKMGNTRKPPVNGTSSKKPITGSGKAASAPSKPAKDEPLRYKISDDDVMSLIENVISAEILSGISNSNWKERLSAMEKLYNFLNEIENLKDIEAELIIRFLSKKPGWKDSNFQVFTKSFNILQLLAEKFPSFSKACVVLSITPLFDKLGDIKMKKPAGETLLTYSEKTSLQFVLSSAYEPMSKQKAPKVQADAILWIQQAINEFGIAGLSIRELIEFLKSSPLKSSNAAVRTNAIVLLGILRTFVGPDIRTFVQDQTTLLLQTIDAEFERVADFKPPTPTRQSFGITAQGKVNSLNDNKAGQKVTIGTENDPMDDLFPRIDINTIISAKTLTMCGDANWKVRKEGLDEIIAQLEVNKRLKPNLGDVAPMLKGRLADPNKPLQMLTLDIISRIANGMNKNFDKYVRIFTGPIAAILADQKSHVRASAITALDTIFNNCGLDHMVGSIGTVLASENPVLRKDLLGWLAEHLTITKETSNLSDLSPLVEPLLSSLLDKNGDIRKFAQACLPFIVQSVGYDYVISRTHDLKGAAKSTIMPFIQSANLIANEVSTSTSVPPPTHSTRPTTTTRPPPRSMSRESIATVPEEDPSDNAFKSKLLKRKGPGILRTQGSRMSVTIGSTNSGIQPSQPTESDEFSPPLKSADSKPKQIRFTKESAMHGKWLADGSPTCVIIDTLAEQMEPHVSTHFYGQLFSKSHTADREALVAITTLDECINDLAYSQDHFGITFEEFKTRTIANSDLLLKYITIRLYDSNTTMILKCLELLEHLFALLDEDSYHLLETEAASLLPTLINKLGDAKEVIRSNSRCLLKPISRVYPSSKIFQYLLDFGTTNKNSRTRAESIDELAALIQRHGLDVCQPTKVLPIIAKHIGDRDANVRTAAINVIVQAYIHLGDNVYKSLGQLSDKDRTLLDERLKRANGVNGVNSSASPIPQAIKRSGIRPPSRSGGLPHPSPSKLREPINRMSYGGSKIMTSSKLVPSNGRSGGGSGGGGMSGIGRPRSSIIPPGSLMTSPKHPGMMSPPPSRLQFQQNLQSHEEEHQEPHFDDNMSSRPTSSTYSEEEPPPIDYGTVMNGFDHQEIEMDLITTEIISEDPIRSIDALKKVEKDLSTTPDHIIPYADQIINAITLQVHLAYTKLDANDQSILRLCKHLVNALVLFFNNNELAQSVTPDSLHQLLSELAHRLLDPKLQDFESIAPLSKALNVTMVKVLENSDKNSSISALLSLLLSSAAELRNGDEFMIQTKTKYTELIMKCLWKLARLTKESLASGQLSASQLILDINNFFMDTAPAEWKRRASDNVPLGDMPLRTMKTLLSEIVSFYGDSVYEYLDLVEDPHLSFVYPYLHHMLESKHKKSLSTSGTQNGNNNETGNISQLSVISPIKSQIQNEMNSSGNIPGSPSLHETDINNRLTEIFTKIGNRQETKQGILELYEFQKSYPQSEPKIAAQLSKTGTYFQSYIRRGLANIAAEDAEKFPITSTTMVHPNRVDSPLASPQRESTIRDSVQSFASIGSDEAIDPYKQKLLRLQQMFGYSRGGITTGATEITSTSGGLNSSLTRSPPIGDIQSEENDENGLRASQISGLKERLAMFKKTGET